MLNLSIKTHVRVLEGGFADVVAFAATGGEGGGMDGEAVGYDFWGVERERA